MSWTPIRPSGRRASEEVAVQCRSHSANVVKLYITVTIWKRKEKYIFKKTYQVMSFGPLLSLDTISGIVKWEQNLYLQHKLEHCQWHRAVFFFGIPHHAALCLSPVPSIVVPSKSGWWLPISFCKSHHDMAACPTVMYRYLNQTYLTLISNRKKKHLGLWLPLS